MLSRFLWFTALTLTALGLVPGAAHVLELPVKLGYPPAFYADVTSTLYAWFGFAGGAVQVGAIIAVGSLAVFLRRARTAGLLLAADGALIASLLLWGVLVAPVNAGWASAGTPGSPEFVAAYEELRSRWEFGHVSAFIAWAVGWLALAGAAASASSGEQTA